MTRWLRAALLVSLVVAVAACKRAESPAPPVPTTPPPTAAAPPATPPPLVVAGVQVGKSLGPDGKSIGEAATAFAATDTFYASVRTTGAASAPRQLAAQWTYEDGQVVKDDAQDIQPSGPAVHEFHISKPDGWPAGKYKVAISLDGKPVGEQSFEVK
jgi:hypothetical protein